MPQPDDAVAVAMSGGHVKELDRFPAVIVRAELHRVEMVSFVRPGALGRRRFLARWRAHPRHDVLVRKHHGAFASDHFKRDAPSRGRELRVAADMVHRRARVDDVGDRLGRQLLDRFEHLVGHRLGTCVDDDRALIERHHSDVAAGARKHVHVRSDFRDADGAGRCCALARRASAGLGGGLRTTGLRADNDGRRRKRARREGNATCPARRHGCPAGFSFLR